VLRKQDGFGGCYNKEEQRRKRKLFIDIPVAADYVVKCTTTEIEHMDREERLQDLINGHSVRSRWLLNALARQAPPADKWVSKQIEQRMFRQYQSEDLRL
jgi:hypothetical protein